MGDPYKSAGQNHMATYVDAGAKVESTYHCNYCGFIGVTTHSCTECIKTLKMYYEYHGGYKPTRRDEPI